jgi:hypothetical protein
MSHKWEKQSHPEHIFEDTFTQVRPKPRRPKAHFSPGNERTIETLEQLSFALVSRGGIRVHAEWMLTLPGVA